MNIGNWRKCVQNFGAIVLLLAASGCSADGLSVETVSSEGQALSHIWDGNMTIAGLDVATTTRGTGKLDVFTARDPSASGGIRVNRYSLPSWASPAWLAPPSGVMLEAVAVANNANRLELIAAGSDRKVYYCHSTTSGSGSLSYTSWTPIAGSSVRPQPDQIGIFAWPNGDLHAFWITFAGSVAHAWGTNNLSGGMDSGDNGIAFLQPLQTPTSLQVVSMAPGRLDIILAMGNRKIQRLWYDDTAGFWGGPPAFHKEMLFLNKSPGGTDFDFGPTSFAATADSSSTFRVMTGDGDRAPENAAYFAQFNRSSGWVGLSGGVIPFSRMSTTVAPPRALQDSLTWKDGVSSSTRIDAFGANPEGRIYELAYYK